MNTWLKNRKVRLFGINTPEIKSKNEEERKQAIKARDFVQRRIPVDSQVVIETHKDKSGKYGRLLATVYLLDGSNINNMLVARGLAGNVNF